MLLLLLAACDDVPLPETCAELVPPPVVACFGADDLDWPGYGTLDVAGEGTVVAVSTGARPDACLADVGNEPFDAGTIVEIEDAEGAHFTVAFAVPDLADTLVSVGDAVALAATYTPGEWGPDEGTVSLAWDGEVRVLVSEAGSLDALSPAFVVAEGTKRCTEDDGCGVWSKYDVDVTADSETVSIPYGESAVVGGARFVHGGYEHSADGEVTCPDWFVAQATVAMVVD